MPQNKLLKFLTVLTFVVFAAGIAHNFYLDRKMMAHNIKKFNELSAIAEKDADWISIADQLQQHGFVFIEIPKSASGSRTAGSDSSAEGTPAKNASHETGDARKKEYRFFACRWNRVGIPENASPDTLKKAMEAELRADAVSPRSPHSAIVKVDAETGKIVSVTH